MPKYKGDDFKNMIIDGMNRGLTDVEIAKEHGCSTPTVSCFRQRHIGPNNNYLKHRTKYRLIEKDVFKFFQNNSIEDCMKKFNLSKSEIKSLFTYGYKKESLKIFRKDSRRKDKWTEYQIKEMLKCIGLLNRKEIAKRIGRGNERVIKEKLQHLGLKYPKYTNGLTISRFRNIFGCEPGFYLDTKAGPGRGKNSSTFFKIVPWCFIKDSIKQKDLDVASPIAAWVNAMADFQELVHGDDVYGSLFDIVYGEGDEKNS